MAEPEGAAKARARPVQPHQKRLFLDWLAAHGHNLHPTRAQKEDLARQLDANVMQVSRLFAKHRRLQNQKRVEEGGSNEVDEPLPSTSAINELVEDVVNVIIASTRAARPNNAGKKWTKGRRRETKGDGTKNQPDGRCVALAKRKGHGHKTEQKEIVENEEGPESGNGTKHKDMTEKTKSSDGKCQLTCEETLDDGFDQSDGEDTSENVQFDKDFVQVDGIEEDVDAKASEEDMVVQEGIGVTTTAPLVFQQQLQQLLELQRQKHVGVENGQPKLQLTALTEHLNNMQTPRPHGTQLALNQLITSSAPSSSTPPHTATTTTTTTTTGSGSPSAAMLFPGAANGLGPLLQGAALDPAGPFGFALQLLQQHQAAAPPHKLHHHHHPQHQTTAAAAPQLLAELHQLLAAHQQQQQQQHQLHQLQQQQQQLHQQQQQQLNPLRQLLELHHKRQQLAARPPLASPLTQLEPCVDEKPAETHAHWMSPPLSAHTPTSSGSPPRADEDLAVRAASLSDRDTGFSEGSASPPLGPAATPPVAVSSPVPAPSSTSAASSSSAAAASSSSLPTDCSANTSPSTPRNWSSTSNSLLSSANNSSLPNGHSSRLSTSSAHTTNSSAAPATDSSGGRDKHGGQKRNGAVEAQTPRRSHKRRAGLPLRDAAGAKRARLVDALLRADRAHLPRKFRALTDNESVAVAVLACLAQGAI